MKRATLYVAVGCSFVVGILTFTLLLSPCLLVVWLLYPSATIYFAWLILCLSVLMSYYFISRIYRNMDSANCRRIEMLKTKYPDIWQRIVKEHFRKPLIPFLRDAVSGRGRSAEEEFLRAVELVELMEGAHSSSEKNRRDIEC